jgi:hypothetical protein
MNCTLCEKPINNYDVNFNHLPIDENHAAHICAECIDKFVRWHGKKLAILFPTNALKKRFGKKQ